MVALECASHVIDPKLVSIEPDCIAEGQLWLLEEETNAVVASLEASMNAMQGQFNIGNEAFQNCNIAEEAEAAGAATKLQAAFRGKAARAEQQAQSGAAGETSGV